MDLWQYSLEAGQRAQATGAHEEAARYFMCACARARARAPSWPAATAAAALVCSYRALAELYLSEGLWQAGLRTYVDALHQVRDGAVRTANGGEQRLWLRTHALCSALLYSAARRSEHAFEPDAESARWPLRRISRRTAQIRLLRGAPEPAALGTGPAAV